MEKILLIIAIILLAISVAIGIANLITSRKKKNGGNANGDVFSEIDTLNNNLNEVKNLINEHTTTERKALSESFKTSNESLMQGISMYMTEIRDTIKDNLKSSNDTLKEIRQEMKTATEDMSKGTGESLSLLKKDMQDTLDKMSKSISEALDKIDYNLKQSLKDVRDDNEKQLTKVRENNAEQLDKMRQTVDEKLNETLDKRIKDAFSLVTNSISQVEKGFGEMRELTGKVTNLNKMFTNVKTRGGWGEVALESLLSQILSPEQYHSQFRLDAKSREMVDFAIVMPGQGKDLVYLPIDSKFPLDKYVTLVEVSESGDIERTDIAKKELFNAVRDEAKSISRKYIITGVTTRFAVMYLPSEGMYAEIARDSAFVSHIQNEYHVTICGPTTITALLNSLQMGFTTLKIQKQSGEIAKALQEFQKDFKKYTGLVEKVRGQAESVVKNISEIEDRNRKINKRLAKASGDLPQDDGIELIASDTVDDDTDGE